MKYAFLVYVIICLFFTLQASDSRELITYSDSPLSSPGLFSPSYLGSYHSTERARTHEKLLEKFKKTVHIHHLRFAELIELEKNSISLFENHLLWSERRILAQLSITIQDKFGKPYEIPTLIYALYAHDFIAAAYLLHYGANPYETYKGKTALEVAQECDAPEELQALLLEDEITLKQIEELKITLHELLPR